MHLPQLIQGRLLGRPNRFTAQVALEEESPVLAHCPNTGSMLGCSLPGQTVCLSRANNPKRKLSYTWEMIQMPSSWVGVNTMLANRIVLEALQNKMIQELASYSKIRQEVKTAANSRIDFLLQGNRLQQCYLEVKSCTWVREQTASFPDAPTLRGQKHLALLRDLQAQGFNTAILYLIQRQDAKTFSPAQDIDPRYALLLQEARKAGTKVLAYDVQFDSQEISLHKRIPLG
ncbi:MAG: DNA/RNA nuclease SfsA [Desulfohalobiaceae bacterium]